MTKYHVCIVDDELPTAMALQQDIRRTCVDIGNIEIFTTLGAAIQAFQLQPPHIVMLDIRLGHTSGLELFNHFPQPTFQTIVVTAFDSFAIDAIKLQVADYLLKPVNTLELQHAIATAIARLHQHLATRKPPFPGRIAIPSQDKITIIDTSSILYCHAQSNYCWIALHSGEKICASATLAAVFERLDPDRFIRIHQSYVVARQAIARYHHAEGGFIELSNDARLPVSRSYKKILLDYLKELIVR